MCSQLFSAAHSSSHFKDFKYYYFHNCIYGNLYKDMSRRDAVSTEHILRTTDSDYRVIIVGDARMSPWELHEKWGSINPWEQTATPGMVWLKRFSDHFRHTVWLNPDSPQFWNHATVEEIKHIFPMFPLTLEGLGGGVHKLTAKK